MRKVPLARLSIDESEMDEVKKVLDSGWLTKGPKNTELETIVSNFLDVKHVMCTSSCTTALHLALLGIEIKRDDEVLVADYTFPATGHSVMFCGAKPVFVDIDKNTYNIDPNKIIDKITDKTKAIIAVHTFGQSADMDYIQDIADVFNLKVIEDAACAIGSKYKERFCGINSDVGCFSMHATKALGVGEGGLIVTNDDEIAKRFKNFGVFGMKSTYDREISNEFIVPVFENIGYNYKMSDVAAAIGIAQFRKIKNINEKRRVLAAYWDERLEKIDYIIKPFVEEYNYHNYQGYCTLVDENINRNKLIQTLKNKGIQTQIGTYSSCIQPCYDSKDECPVSLDIYNRAFRLPLYPDLSFDDIDYVCEVLNEIKEDVLI